MIVVVRALVVIIALTGCGRLGSDFEGTIDEVMIFDRALDETEIGQLALLP